MTVLSRLIGVVDRQVDRALRAQHPALMKADGLVKRAVGPLQVQRAVVVGGPAEPAFSPNVFISGSSDGGGKPIAPEFPTGIVIGASRKQYRITKPLSEGGMSTNYRVVGRDGRPGFLKVLAMPGSADDNLRLEIATRFKNEINILRKNVSPYIVKLIDYDPAAQPIFYVMEHINGDNLGAALYRIAAKRVSPDRPAVDPVMAAGIIKQVLEALIAYGTSLAPDDPDAQYAHRDLKPDNIMLEMVGGNKVRATLIDFGIAKIPGSSLTGVGFAGFRGTPDYAAPETFTNSKVADQRSDIYSLGLILYHMLMGEPLYEVPLSDNPVVFWSDITNFLNRLPDLLVEKYNQPLPDWMPQALWNITFLCLNVDPDSRFQNYRFLKAELDKFLAV